MRNHPLVTVLLPAFNAASTLPQAIDSILSQTFSNLELLIVNDGSTDKTASVLAHYRDPRLRVVHRPHRGIVAALNAGLALARGRWIARMDADDRCSPQRLEIQWRYLQEHPQVDVLGCRVAAFPEERLTPGMRRYLTWVNAALTHDDIVRDIFIEMPMLHPTLMMRRSALLEVGGYREGPFSEDYDLFLRLYFAGKRFARVPEVLYFWHYHDHQLSRTHPRYSEAAFRRLKASYLADRLLDGRRFRICGCGRLGKRLYRALQEYHRRPEAFVDLAPRKVGRRWNGIPIIPYEAVQKDGTLHLVCVGVEGAREQIRRVLSTRGLNEGEDFLCVA